MHERCWVDCFACLLPCGSPSRTEQTGTLAEAFAKHEKDPKIIEDVQVCRDALKEVGNIFGWHVM